MQQLHFLQPQTCRGNIPSVTLQAEVDRMVLRDNAKESFLIGSLSFLAPFLGTMFVCHYFMHWPWAPARLAGIALSTTSLAVVYAVLVETGPTNTEIGKIIMAATFVTAFGTALGLSLLFISPNINTVWFAVISIGMIAVLPRIAPHVFRRYGKRVIEPEIKAVPSPRSSLYNLAHEYGPDNGNDPFTVRLSGRNHQPGTILSTGRSSGCECNLPHFPCPKILPPAPFV
jgi:hypothetical protein